MIRPEVIALLRRWLGVIEGAAVFLWGVWLLWRATSLIPQLVALALIALGLAWGLNGWRRMRFQGAPSAPGLIEIDEGRLRYLHPRMGGEVSLHDLAELRLVTMHGRRVWQLTDLAGDALLVPLDAAGAGDLFDAFASLPGLTSADLVAALGPEHANPDALPATPLLNRRVWRRAGAGLMRQ